VHIQTQLYVYSRVNKYWICGKCEVALVLKVNVMLLSEKNVSVHESNYLDREMYSLDLILWWKLYP
jgi:hypothetical protein